MDKLQLAEFLFRLSLLFVPGFIARIILGKLLYYKNDEPFHFVIHSFLLGCVSYAFLSIVYSVLNLFGPCTGFTLENQFFKCLQNECSKVNLRDVFVSSFLAVPVAFLISYIEKEKIVTRFAMKCGITARFSEPGVWGYLLGSEEILKNPWVTVRDKGKNLAYQGCVRAFSDTHAEAELLLSDVVVFENDTGHRLYSLGMIYLTFKPEDITIEKNDTVVKNS